MSKSIIVIKQSSEKDCGPACLLSIIKYYGGNIPLENIKMDCKINKEGTNFYDILKAANKYGFEGDGYELNKEKIYDDLRVFPAICQFVIRGYNHFIVIYKIDRTYAYIMDPAIGKKSIPINEFFEKWTGLILELYPKQKILIINSDNKILDIIYIIFNKEKYLIFKIIFASIVITVTSIISSFYFKFTIDNIHKDTTNLKFMFLFFLFIFLLKSIVFFVRNYYEIFLSKNINVYFYKDFFSHLFNLPSKIIETKPIGEIITRFNDLTKIKNIIVEFIVSIFLDLLLTFVAFIVLFNINYKLSLLLLVSLIIYSLFAVVFSKILYKRIIFNKEYESEFSTVLNENIMLYSNIKNLNKVDKVLYKIEKVFSRYIFDNYNIEKINSYHMSIKNFINEMSYFIINGLGVYEIYKGNITITDLITFNTLMMLFLEPIKNFLDNISKFSYMKASLFKINEFMSIKEESVGILQDINKWSIKVNKLSFGYNDFDKIINNLSLNILQNNHVLFMGSSGSGKSSLCKLLLKIENDYTGDIMIGDINLKDISVNTIRHNIVYISQREYLFSGTIKENIEFLRNVELEQLNEISKLCCIDNILNKKKLRYDSFIEKDYNSLSGGEKQRIILARGLINNFKILIIDEALSEVDKETEAKIIKKIQKRYKDKIIIYISHKDVKKHFTKVVSFE